MLATGGDLSEQLLTPTTSTQTCRRSTPLRVGFVNLRARTRDWHHVIMVPLGIMYLSAAIKRTLGDQVAVDLFDATTHPELQAPDDAMRAWLRAFQPDVVAIRGFSSQAAEFPIVASMAKEERPGCLVLAGGPHASTGSAQLYAIEDIDLICPNEGEEVIVDVLRCVLERRPCADVPGIGWRGRDGRPEHAMPRPQVQDLDALPFPDYDVIDLDAYQGRVTMTDFLPRARFSSLFTSRGCYYRCSYCHTNFGKRVRYRSVDNVLDEMSMLMETQGVREFHIIDDIFNADRDRALAIFDAIVRRGWKVHLAFPNGLRADRMDEEFVQAARQAGTYYWALAVETATPRLQKLVRKHNKLERVFETIELSDKHDIITCTFNMLGFPTETEQEMCETIRYTLRSKAHLTHFFAVTPYEGTSLHDELGTWGIDPSELDDELLGYQHFEDSENCSTLGPVSRKQIETLIVQANQRFYFDPVRLGRMIELHPDPVHLALHVELRRWAAGYDWATIPDRRAARLLAGLFTAARARDPKRCARLPVPPDDLLHADAAAQ